MAKFLAVFIAYLFLCSGYHIFRKYPEITEDSPSPSLIFLTSVFFLLCEIRLYPKRLRKLGQWCQTFIEFLMALFAMETVLLDFWFPLVHGITALCRQLSQNIDELTDYEERFQYVSEILKSSSTLDVITTTLSLFLLFSVLHATRAVDFRTFEDGPCRFLEDVICRGKRFIYKNIKALISGNRHVTIKERDGTTCRCRTSEDRDSQNTEGFINLNDIDSLSSISEFNIHDRIEQDYPSYMDFEMLEYDELFLSD